MKVIGIDPGIGRVGYAIVDVDGHNLKAHEYGCITTSSTKDVASRLCEIKKDLTKLIVMHKPEAAVIERLVFVHNSTSALAVSQARGVILMILKEHNISISEYAPTEIKKAVTSSGAAGKREIGAAVRLIFGLKAIPRPDDAADALALAVCYASQVK